MNGPLGVMSRAREMQVLLLVRVQMMRLVPALALLVPFRAVMPEKDRSRLPVRRHSSRHAPQWACSTGRLQALGETRAL